MKRTIVFLLAGMMLVSACGKAPSGKIEASDYWTRSSMAGNTGAVYMILTNGTGQDDQLLGASSDVAEAVEVHKSMVDANGVMQMQPQEFVDLPKGEAVEFKPGGLHIMFIGLKKDLNIGETITVTLHFKNYEDVTLTVPVKDATNMGGSGMDGMP